ncbi:hypothetical protein V1389_09110 [Flavobacterium rakeshii]|uniref:glycine-rich domain-containing protein n=1 Tax=Flavobacterium rakeshii TaxID=1038845 RepID=UPI002E7BBCDE|nr:hypothetical protein [Flavobacterium rakeshii]MEE1898493.1 hypothetical protein [Flavobacterium rakeshii]
MTAPQKELWDKISNFRLDDPDASFTFSARLARENGWTKEYTNSVIEEYRKFIFVCCVSKSSVTPSDPVNQVWHLHLTYTKSYWIDFCKNTLQREIHHKPTKDAYLLGILVAISIQASGGIGVGIVMLIGFIIAIYSAIKNDGNDKGNSNGGSTGCSTSNHENFESGCSSHGDSGCRSGCNGCSEY